MDHTLFRWINDFAGHTTWLHAPVKLYASAGIAVFAALLVVSYLDARRRGDARAVAASVWAGGAALVALGVAQIVGQAVDRARPYDALANVHVLVARTTDFSFPSDHATVSGAIAVGLLLARRRWGVVAGVAALLMAFARVYVGAHYPGDVAAGLALGGLVAALGHVTVVPLLSRLVDRLAGTAVRPVVASGPRI